MTVVIALIAFLFGLCLIISLHELGHFLFAKKFNVLCYDYSIGMGPLIYGKRKGETLYGIRAIPLGGFVAMADGDMGNRLLEKDCEIGINVNENNVITDIIFNNVMESQMIGKVVDKDIYCEDGKTPFIILNINGEEINYEVDLKANIYLKRDKPMQIAPYDRCFEWGSLDRAPEDVRPVLHFGRFVKPILLQQRDQFIFHDVGKSLLVRLF